MNTKVCTYKELLIEKIGIMFTIKREEKILAATLPLLRGNRKEVKLVQPFLKKKMYNCVAKLARTCVQFILIVNKFADKQISIRSLISHRIFD